MFRSSLFLMPVFLFSFVLEPQPQVAITNDGSVSSGVSVAGTANGFMAVWQDSMSQVVSSFSPDNGISWNSPVALPESTIYQAFVAARDSEYVVSWVRADIGFSSGNVVTSISTNQGTSWSMPDQISPPYVSPGGRAYPPSRICAGAQGFMCAWVAEDMGDNNIWTNFSTDGVSWDAGLAIQVNPSGLGADFNQIAVAVNTSGFMVVWLRFSMDTMLYEVYSSFSSNLGATWSSPVRINDNIGAGSAIDLSATSAGFLVTWSNSSSEAYSSFSSNQGGTWSSPSLVASNLFSFSAPVISSGTSAGFVVAYFDNDGNIGARFSSNGGLVWDAPVGVVTDGSAVKSNVNFVGVSAISGHCLFTWYSNDSNGYSSASIFPVSASNSAASPSTLFRMIDPNNPRNGLFN